MPPQHALDRLTFHSPVASRIRTRLESLSPMNMFAPPPAAPPTAGKSAAPQRRLSNDSETSTTCSSSSSSTSLRDDAECLPLVTGDREPGAPYSRSLSMSMEAAPASTSETSSTNLLASSASASSATSGSAVDRRAPKLLFGAAGVYACYLVYGHIQEDVFRYRSPTDGGAFTYVWCLQVLECACNVCFAAVGRRVCGGRTPQSYRPFLLSGASQVVSKVLTSASLAAGLSFPVCILTKSAKMVPVMLGQLLLGGSRYRARDYLFAGLVVLGTTLLSLDRGGSTGGDSKPSFSTPLGLAFIALSLVADGVTGGLQKRLKQEMAARPPTALDFALFTNLAMGAVALAIALPLGDLGRGLRFLADNPLLLQMVLCVCLLSTLGQFFVFYIVAQFDPVVCATVTTTRKMLSVAWSVAAKGHAVSAQGYLGLAVAAAGIAGVLPDHATAAGGGGRPAKAAAKKATGGNPVGCDLC